ncbi:MAG: hypothetical protein AB1420_17310 [Bacillota bacterium]
MNVIVYALFTYALTAIIAFGVIALIVFVNYLMNTKNSGKINNKKEGLSS